MILKDFNIKTNRSYELAQKFIKFRKMRSKKYNYLRNYNISIEEVFNLKKIQNYKCAICFKDLDNGKRTHVDHDHFTCKIRGVLCVNCNLGLGNFKDNVEVLENAIKYLTRNASTEPLEGH